MSSQSHIHKDEHGTSCRYCMSPVGEDGFAPLGEEEQFTNFEGESTDQQNATERMRDDSGFTDAVQRMSRGGYAGGGKVEDEGYSDENWFNNKIDPPGEFEQIKRGDPRQTAANMQRSGAQYLATNPPAQSPDAAIRMAEIKAAKKEREFNDEFQTTPEELAAKKKARYGGQGRGSR